MKVPYELCGSLTSSLKKWRKPALSQILAVLLSVLRCLVTPAITATRHVISWVHCRVAFAVSRQCTLRAGTPSNTWSRGWEGAQGWRVVPSQGKHLERRARRPASKAQAAMEPKTRDRSHLAQRPCPDTAPSRKTKHDVAALLTYRRSAAPKEASRRCPGSTHVVIGRVPTPGTNNSPVLSGLASAASTRPSPTPLHLHPL